MFKESGYRTKIFILELLYTLVTGVISGKCDKLILLIILHFQIKHDTI